jgi:hypothetical protein
LQPVFFFIFFGEDFLEVAIVPTVCQPMRLQLDA